MLCSNYHEHNACIACRFGSTDEVGLFEMTQGGLATVLDPAALLKERSAAAAAAACAAAVVVEANRPMVVEIQVRLFKFSYVGKFSNSSRVCETLACAFSVFPCAV